MRFRSVLLILALSLLAACNTPGTSTPAAKPTAAPAVPTSLPTQAPVPGVLPRSVYYIGPSSAGNQIWRLDVDGVTQTQITHEPSDVTNFDVSPVDGAIVLVSGNKIIKVDALGANRVELLQGPAISPNPGPDQINTTIGYVIWKPDGTQIAYGLNGVNLIAAGGGTPEQVQATDVIPATPDPAVASKFYSPIAWSPDGTRILMNVSFYPEGGSLAVKTLGGGAPIMLNNPDGWPCCNPTWSLNGSAVFLSNDYPGLIPAGLWTLDTASGQGKALIGGAQDTGPTINLISQARQLADQRLYYFMTKTDQFPNEQSAVAMYSSAVDGTTDRKQLRTDTYVVGEALWDVNHTGAIIRLAGHPYSDTGTATAPLVWLKTDNSAAVQLSAMGFNLHWGK